MRTMENFGVEPAFGIDLGTTNSAIAVVGNGNKAEIIPIDGYQTMPSCVMWMGGDNFIVGREAYKNRAESNVAYSVKRLMGTNSDIKLTYEGKTKSFTPCELSAEILKALVAKARSGLYKSISDVVITVPAYFNDKQISDTLKAGELAGLKVLSIMKEPTAGCLLYNQSNPESGSKKVLVYDLGGGTFDISAVMISNSEDNTDLDDIYGDSSEDSSEMKSSGSLFSVLCVDGDTNLGGDDIDRILLELVLKRVIKEHPHLKRSSFTKQELESLLLKLEISKKSGSSYYIITHTLGGESIQFNVGLEDFEKAYSAVYNRTYEKLKNVLQNPVVGKISQIIAIGGSTKSEAIIDRLKHDFPRAVINNSMHPDESVALGAAIQAKRLKFGDDTTQILDCLALNIGVLSEGYISPVLKAGQQIPCESVKSYATESVGQTTADLDIYQGNSRYPSECLFLGRMRLEDIQASSDSDTHIVIKMSIDSNGLHRVAAKTSGANWKVIELINVLGASSNLQTISDKSKKITRWKAFAQRLATADKEKLLYFIQNYEETDEGEEAIINFISTNKGKKSVKDC